MDFKVTERDFWHDRLLLMGKDHDIKKYGKQISGNQAQAIVELKTCTFEPQTLSKSSNKVRIDYSV